MTLVKSRKLRAVLIRIFSQDQTFEPKAEAIFFGCNIYTDLGYRCIQRGENCGIDKVGPFPLDAFCPVTG